MIIAIATLRILIAALFAVSGLAKAVDRSGTREGARDLGLPRPLAQMAGIALPIAEVAIATALVAGGTAWWGALAATVLLAAFAVIIAANLARGRHPACRCFGRLSSASVGWQTLVRNVVLATGTGVIVLAGPTRSTQNAFIALGQGWSTAGGTSVAVAALVGVLGVQVTLTLAVLRRYGALLNRLEVLEGSVPEHGADTAAAVSPGAGRMVPEVGLTPGVRAPDFTAIDSQNAPVTLQSLLDQVRSLLLIFTDPECGPCHALVAGLHGWEPATSTRLRVVLITHGSVADQANAWGDADDVLFQRRREVADAYQSGATPQGVLITPDGLIGSRLASGAPEIRRLVDDFESARLRPTPPTGGQNLPMANSPRLPLPVGALAPDVKLRGGDGADLRLSDVWGEPTLLVFWNSSCGFCRKLLPELQAWEAGRAEGLPGLFVVSTAAPTTALVDQFRSPVAFDVNHEAAAAFEAWGTPAGLLLDADGRVASTLVFGGPGVMELTERLTEVNVDEQPTR